MTMQIALYTILFLIALATLFFVAIGLGLALFFSTIQTFDVNVKIDDTGEYL
jgi:hypothetical protein